MWQQKLLLVVIILFSFSLVYAEDIGNTNIIDNPKLNQSGLTIEVKTLDEIQWKQDGNSFTPEYKNLTKYNIDSKTGEKILKPIPEITFTVNKIEDIICTYSFYQTTCYGSRWDFSKFENKNTIVSKEIIINYKDEGFIEDLKDLIGIGDGKIIESYDIRYTGLIIDLDPSLELVYTSSNNLIFINATEGSNLGARLSAPLLFMDFNERNQSTYIKDNSLYNSFGTIGLNTAFPIYNETGGYDGSGAYQYDGVNDFISGQILPSTTFEKITISVWIKPNATTTTMGIVDTYLSTSYRYVLRKSAGVMNFYFNGGTTALTTTFPTTNAWTHVVAIYNGTNQTIYYNGVLNASAGITTWGPAATQSRAIDTFYIGQDVGAYWWNGSIDQVMILPYALSAGQVLTLYNGTLNNSNYIGKYGESGGNFKSLVFYNSTSTYWNTTLSLADSNGSREIYDICQNDVNCVSYWDLDNGNYYVNPYNDEKENNDGISYGTNNATGLSSGAIFLDGINDWINISNKDKFNFASNFTVSYWAYANKVNNKYAIGNYGYQARGNVNNTGWGSRLGIYGDGVGYLNWIPNDGSNIGCYIEEVSGVTLSTNTWYHIAVSYNDTSVLLYINGVNKPVKMWKDSTPARTEIATPLGIEYTSNKFTNMMIGAYNDLYNNNIGNYFNGTLDEVLIYNKSLSASEVTQLYKSGLSQHANTNVTLQIRTANNYNITDSNLVSFYAFSDNTTAIDETGKVNGIYMNGALVNLTSGIIGNGTSLDGTNDYINLSTLGGDVNSTTGFTIGLWAYPMGTSMNNYRLISRRGASTQYDIYLSDSGGQGRLSTYNGVGTCYVTAYEIPLNKWTYLTVTNNRTHTKMYYDGIEKTATTNCVGANAVFTSFNTDTYIGRYGTSYFKGLMDEVRIYNRTLSADEVLDLYNLGATHISDWSAWSSETAVSDGVPVMSSGSGKFMQFKASLNSNTTEVSPYVINHSITSTPQPITDVTPPYFITIPENKTINYTQGLLVQFVGNDTSGLPVTYSINWTDTFEINSSGYLYNITVNLPIGEYEINVTVTDTALNINSTMWKITVNKATPIVGLYLNYSRADLLQSSSGFVDIYANLSNGDQTSMILYLNNYPVLYGSIPLNTSQLINKIGMYKFNATIAETTSYNGASETWYVNYSITNEVPMMADARKVWYNYTDNTVFGFIKGNNLTWYGNLFYNNSYVTGCVRTNNETMGECS